MSILSIIQITVSILLIFLILFQQKGTALGSAFGGSGETFYSERRGIEKNIYWATIVLAVLFIATSLGNLLI